MKHTVITLSTFISICTVSAVVANEQKPVLLEAVQVQGKVEVNKEVFALPDDIVSAVDTSDLLKRLPGANVNKNGPLTGIPQYRGMFGDRVNVTTDGVNVKAAGPNSMDPAMSHLPPSLTESVVLNRGIAPISSGIETVGSSVHIHAKSADFGMEDKAEVHGEASAGVSSVDSGNEASIFLSSATQNHKFYTGLSTEEGDSFKFNGRTNVSTEYERQAYLLGYGFQSDDEKHQFDLKYNYNNTGATGTPALPMDIVYAKGGVLSMDYQNQLQDDLRVSAGVSTQESDHLMNNYQFRNNVAPNRRYAYTDVKSNGYQLNAEKTLSAGKINFGLEGDTADHTATIYNPDNANFRITNYDVERNRNSLFTELSKPLSNNLTMQAGARYTRVDMNANDVSSSMSGTNSMHRTLQNRFNASDRNKTDNNLDVVFNLEHKLSDKVTLNYGIARKNRSPSYQERYLWLPLESTSGLADGRRYLGNINLKPETANQLELGADIKIGKSGYISPHAFYHRVNDYIQGTPTTSQPAPPNTLTFNNVEAELYGFDVDFGNQLTSNLFLDGTFSYVRGKRLDIDDNLYRIAPANTRIGLRYEKANWSVGGDVTAYAKQDKVSSTNSEQASGGYTLLNLQSEYEIKKNLKLAVGINNVLDKKYSSHLGGYNRNNRNVDVGFNAANNQGFRLPESGRNIFANIKYEW